MCLENGLPATMSFKGSSIVVISPSREYQSTPVPSETGEKTHARLEHFEVVEGTRQCCVTSWFFVITILLIADIATDVMLVTYFGVQQHMVYVGIGLMFFVLASFTIGTIYVVQAPPDSEKVRNMRLVAGCWLCNVPLQLGVIFQRFVYISRRCDNCCGQDWKSTPSQTEWVLAKLKLVHSLVQSAPMLVINLLHMLVFGNVHAIQYISAGVSFASLVIGMASYENCRRAHVRKVHVTAAQSLSVLVYKTLLGTARVAAITHFTYYYGPWLLALLVPHFVVVLLCFTVIYNRVWRVTFAKIAAHSLYCTFDYFPVHNEYRPEGEVVVFYVLVVVENLLMIATPYRQRPTQEVDLSTYAPGTAYYNGVISLVSVATAAGLFVMAAYYFLFHRSSVSIVHTHCSWLERHLCPCLKDQNPKPYTEPRLPEQQNLNMEEGPGAAANDYDFGGSGPPSYTTNPRGDASVGRLNDLHSPTKSGGYDSDPNMSRDYMPPGRRMLPSGEDDVFVDGAPPGVKRSIRGVVV